MNIVAKVATVCLMSLLSACATVKETYSTDGRKGYTLNCSGTGRGWDKCFSAAGEICKDKGYDILDRSSEETARAAVGGNAYGYGGSAVRTQERTMLIACKS